MTMLRVLCIRRSWSGMCSLLSCTWIDKC